MSAAVVSSVLNLSGPGELAITGTERTFQNALRKAFREFDLDHNGTIDRHELASMMISLGKKPAQKKIDAIFQTLDKNGDGEIDFAEFSKYFTASHVEDDTDTYCTCKKPAEGFMIRCDAKFDGCLEWYHGACVDKASKSDLSVWYCPLCTAKAPKKSANKTKITFRKINGKRYDRALIDEVRSFPKDKDISKANADKLLAHVLEDDEYSDLEKDTIAYIRANYTFAPEADEYFRHAIASHAAKRRKGGDAKEEEPKEKEPSKKRKAEEEVSSGSEKKHKASKRTIAEEALDTVLGKEVKDGKLSYDKEKLRKQLRRVFREVDVDHSNSLDREELANLFRKLGRRPITKKIDSIFDTLDTNGDGSIDFDEFLKYFQDEHTVEDDELFCSCRKPQNDKFMIACDGQYKGCHEWYHGECVGVKPKSPETTGAWFCPSCKKKGGEEKSLQRSSSSTTLKHKKLDSGLLKLANESKDKHGKITLAYAKKLEKLVLSDEEYSELEKRTIRYIRQHIDFEPEADEWYRSKIASWASLKGHQHHKEKLESDKKKIKDEIDQWFADNSNKGIQSAAADVASFDLDVVLSVTKADWKALTGSILAAVQILKFLGKYQPAS